MLDRLSLQHNFKQQESMPKHPSANGFLRIQEFRSGSHLIMKRKVPLWPNMSSYILVNQKTNRLIIFMETSRMLIKYYKIQRICLLSPMLSFNNSKCTSEPHWDLVGVPKWHRYLHMESNPLIYPARTTLSFSSRTYSNPISEGTILGLFMACILC